MEAIAHLFKEKSFLFLVFLYFITTTIFFISFHNLAFQFFTTNPVYVILAYCSVLSFGFQCCSTYIVLNYIHHSPSDQPDTPTIYQIDKIVFLYSVFSLLLTATLGVAHFYMLPLQCFLGISFILVVLGAIVSFLYYNRSSR